MKYLFLFLALAGITNAAVDATIVWEIRTTGAQTNGGGYKPGASGSDFSQQASAQYALTGATTSAANAIILHASAATDMVGNVAYVSGTNFTTGWYEIISVVAGVSMTVDRTCATAAASAGVVNVGGAFLIGGTLDDDFTEAATVGNTYWVKSGTYTTGETVAQSAGTGSSTLLTHWSGYTATRGDTCNGADRPLIEHAAFNFSSASNSAVYNLRFNGTAAIAVGSGDSHIYNCKVINSGSANVGGVTPGLGSTWLGCEFISLNGDAVSVSSNYATFINCFMHDSNSGYNSSAIGTLLSGCVIAHNRTRAVGYSGSVTNIPLRTTGCTLYGFNTTPRGIGIDITSASTQGSTVDNCIVYGFATAFKGTTAARDVNQNWNCYLFNNTANYTTYRTGFTDVTATDPAFVGDTEINGSTATTSGSTLTQSGGNFSSVTDNEDFLHVISGTGVTTGGYLITGHTSTTLTTNNALGTSGAGNVVYIVTTGRDFRPGALQGLATFPSGIDTAGSNYPGALQVSGGGQRSSVSVQ